MIWALNVYWPTCSLNIVICPWKTHIGWPLVLSTHSISCPVTPNCSGENPSPVKEHRAWPVQTDQSRTPCLGRGTFIPQQLGVIVWWEGGVGEIWVFPLSTFTKPQPQNGKAIVSAPMACPLRETQAWYGNDMHMYSCDRRLHVPKPTPTNDWEAALLASAPANYILPLLVPRYSRQCFAFHISFPPFNVRPVFGFIVWFQPLQTKIDRFQTILENKVLITYF